MARSSNDRILILQTSKAPVALSDERFLRSRFDVRTFRIRLAPPVRLLANMAALAVWLCWNLPRARGVFFRFADYYAFLPVFLSRVFRRKSWIVLGGYDAHHLPEYDYGVYGQPLRASIVRYAIRNATAVLPVDQSLYDGVNAYAFDPPRATGIKSLVPNLRCEVRVVADGFDHEFWTPSPGCRKERLVVATASVPQGTSRKSRTRMVALKGVPLLLEVARRMPDVAFAIIGPGRGVLPEGGRVVPANVQLPGYLSPEQLREYYRRATVYAHPSLTEGLPAAVAEAMLCCCVPVGSSVNGIPELIGDTGFVVTQPVIDEWAAAVTHALERGASSRARDRIVALFSLAKRHRLLVDVIEG
ncbi:MAG: Capsular glucan synthase [Candidatus Latescibacteria bacterium ADurb.Bin168]|nr:MAG: Capsular glucan synthase [Candidatus Latescibacteria bacterium ADurb.Bin168]